MSVSSWLVGNIGRFCSPLVYNISPVTQNLMPSLTIMQWSHRVEAIFHITSYYNCFILPLFWLHQVYMPPFLCSGLMNPDWRVNATNCWYMPSSKYLDKYCILHRCAFIPVFFCNFLKIGLNMGRHLKGNLTVDSVWWRLIRIDIFCNCQCSETNLKCLSLSEHIELSTLTPD